MKNSILNSFLTSGCVDYSQGNASSFSTDLLPDKLMRAIESLVLRRSLGAKGWRSLVDDYLSGAEGELLMTTFDRKNGYNFKKFEEYFSIKGDGPTAVRDLGGVDIVAMSGQSSSLEYKYSSVSEGLVVHMLAEFPSNVENNFYVTFGGDDKVSFRFSNSEISLVQNPLVMQHDNSNLALYSFAVSQRLASLYINGVLQFSKKITLDSAPSTFCIDILGHDSADLSASIFGLELWSLNEGAEVFGGDAEIYINYRLSQLLLDENIKDSHYLVTRFDNFNFIKFEDRIFSLLDESLTKTNGIKEWVFEEIIAKFEGIKANKWKEHWLKVMPEPTLSVNDLRILFFEKPNERLQLGRLIKRQKSKTFDVLREINFKAYPGDVLGIIGANGAGKSTLLRAVAGLLPVKSGNIVIQGQHLLLSPGMGIRNELSGKDNIYLACCFMGLNLNETNDIYHEIVDFSELHSAIDRPFKFYSDGMKSRLIFSIATAVAPDILMLDELLNAGDIKFQQKAALRMDELISRSKVVVVVTHSIPFVAEKCNKALLISHGRQVSYGSPDIVISKFFNELHMKNPMQNLSDVHQDSAAMQMLQQQSFLPGA